MFRMLRRLVALLCLIAAIGAAAQATPGPAQRLMTRPLDPQSTVTLPEAIRPEATAHNDRGPVAFDRTLDHMQLLLNRPAAREAALAGLLRTLDDPRSPNYHHWLTAAQFGTDYGPAMGDVDEVVAWLRRQGFTVKSIQPSRMVINFSGNAGQIRAAFGVRLHQLDVNGKAHIANMRAPRIPAALGGIVHGIVSLNDFRPHPNFKPRPAYSFSSAGQTEEAVVPADMITIYNLYPLFEAGLSGQGVTIAVIEDSDVYSVADWTSFRSTLGLSVYGSGSLTQVHPSTAAQGCDDPGVAAGDEQEATLDAEWASAAAPNAAIELVSCASSSVQFGGFAALENLINSPAPPPIISFSFSVCETLLGPTGNAALSSLYQQAAAMGVSVFVSTGDGGPATCDSGNANATHGIGVNGLASTPYNVAVGGTDFGDTVAGTSGLYWSAVNSGIYGSAVSYVPEIAWNDSCAGSLITAAEGFAASYGPAGFCNSTMGQQYFLSISGGGGGPSGCALGTASATSIVSGTCQGYAKPSWQSLVGNPADAVRDLPDVSLFAADGLWGHYYVYCDSDAADSGAACTGAPSGWSGAGGTSFAAPIMAGIQALIDQSQGAAEGNPNPVYYAIAASNYGSAGSSLCLSGASGGGMCAFHDITNGDTDVNCIGSANCYQPGGQTGVLSTDATIDAPAFPAHVGWDFATGIGSVNAANLVSSWSAGELLLRPPQ